MHNKKTINEILREQAGIVPEIDIMGNITNPVFKVAPPRPRRIMSPIMKFYFWLRKKFNTNNYDSYECKLKDGKLCSVDWKECYYNCKEHEY